MPPISRRPQRARAGPPSARKRRRNRLAVSASGLATLAAFALRWSHAITSDGLTRYGAATNVVLGVAAISRGVVHIVGHYWNHRAPMNSEWTDAHRHKLNRLVVAEILGGSALGVLGVALVLSDPHPWRALVLTLPAWPIGWYIADQKLELATRAGLPTGTGIIRSCPTIKRARERVRLRVSSENTDRLDIVVFEHQRPKQAFSVVVLFWFFALMGSSGAQLVALVPPSGDWMNRPGHHRPIDQAEEDTPDKGHTETTGSTASPAGSSAGTSQAGGKAALLEDDCTTDPGTGIGDAFSGERDGVALLWRSLGPPSLGCAGLAERVKDADGVFTIPGVCPADGIQRSLVVVGPDHPAAAVMANSKIGVDPVALARRFADEGTLLGASERVSIATGDFQIIFTTHGTWVLARHEQSDGHGGVKSIPKRCAEVVPGGGAYVALPPALAHAWLVASSALEIKTWPFRDVAHDGPGTEAYLLLSTDGLDTPVATAVCDVSPPHRCTLQAEGIAEIAADDGTAAPVDVSAVLRNGPSS